MFWLAVFGLGGRTDGFYDLAMTLNGKAEGLKVLTGLVAALPIGVLIHQMSVLIKNWVVASYFKVFSDFPDYMHALSSQKMLDTHKYCLEKISNLNSYYYVRFDNGFLAPFFAWLVVKVLIGLEINMYLQSTATSIAVVMLAYLPRIYREMIVYDNVLRQQGDTTSAP